MSIVSIMHTIRVKAAPPRAFELFTSRMGQWWPGKTIGRQPHEAIVMEPREGGRWFERDANGIETNWGRVVAWEPPGRVLLLWQVSCDWGYDPEVQTELEIGFLPAEGGGTVVRLEHRNLERFGRDAAEIAEKLRGGWPGKLDGFAAFADERAILAQA